LAKIDSEQDPGSNTMETWGIPIKEMVPSGRSYYDFEKRIFEILVKGRERSKQNVVRLAN